MRETITRGAATAVAPAHVGQAVRPRRVIHALLFVLGLSVIFVAEGAVVSGIGQLVFDLRAPWPGSGVSSSSCSALFRGGWAAWKILSLKRVSTGGWCRSAG